MFIRRWSLVVLPMAAVLGARTLRAQVPATLPSAPSDSIVRLALDPAKNAGRPYVLLLDESVNRIEPDGRTTKRTRQVYQVLDQNAARGLSERAFGYAKSHQSLTVDWIRVLKTTGEVVSDKPAQEQESDVTAQMSNPVYLEQKVRRVSLVGVAVGTVLDVQYTLDERAPYRAGDFLIGWNVNQPFAVVRSRLVVDVPERYTPKIVERNLTFRRTEEVQSGRRIYAWATTELSPVRGEPFAADSNGVVMTVSVTAPGTWSDIARWYDGLARDRYAMTSAVASKVDSLVSASGAHTRLDTIRAVHRWVAQDVRYVSVSLGIGGYQPRLPTDVVASGFGDCKDKATLFVAAMRRYKINANPVLLSLGGRPDPALPSVFQFNHAIAAVQDGAGWTFTDLTAEFVPYGTIPDAYQGQFGIIVLADGQAQEVLFPAASVTASGSSLRARMSVDSTGHVTGNVVEETLGGTSSGMRAMFSAPLDSTRRDGLEKALAQRLFSSDVTVSSITAFDGKDFSMPTVLRYAVTAENTLKSIRENRLFPLNAIFRGPARSFKNLATDLASRTTRLFPIDATQILGPSETITEMTLTLPTGWTADLPKNILATSFFGRYESTWTQQGRDVHLVRRIQGQRGYFPPQRISEIVVWLKTVGADDTEFLSLRPAPVR